MARYLPAAGSALLAERYEVDEGGAEAGRDELLKRVPGAAALVADPTVPVDAELLDAAGASLRVVANFAVGYDNVDVAACRERGVIVTNTPDVLTNATAELAVALMLAAARRLGEAERIVRAGRWTGWEPGQLLGRELSGAVVGIVGLGRIGTRVAELLRGFEVELLYAARSPRPEAERSLGAEHATLDDLLARSDFVTLHVPLSPQTHHLIDAHALGRMKRGAILVNTSRGGLVDAAALAEALTRRAPCRRRARRLRAGAAGPVRADRAGAGRARAARRLGHRHRPRRDGEAGGRERDRGAGRTCAAHARRPGLSCLRAGPAACASPRPSRRAG